MIRMANGIEHVKKPKCFFILFIAITMFVSMMLLGYPVSAASNEEIESAYQMQDGETFDLSNISGTSESRIAIQNPGTYTLTNENYSSSVRIFITADCTLNLDEMLLTNEAQWERDDQGKMVEYMGGTKGAVEIADGVTVNLVLSGSNRITCKKLAGTQYGILYNGFLLGDQSKVIVSGSGELISDSSIGTRLEELSDLNNRATLTIESGLLYCLGVGNSKVNNEDDIYITDQNIVLNYNGGSFYSTRDDLADFPSVKTTHQATQDIYRIKIPASDDAYIRRGGEGAFSQTHGYAGYVYAWVDKEDFETGTPLLFSILSDDGYHVYKADYRNNGFLTDAVLADVDNAASVQGKVSDPYQLLTTGDKLTFVDKNGRNPDMTAAINADGSYSTILPLGSYEVKIATQKNPLDLGEISLPTAGTYLNDFTIEDTLPDVIEVYNVNDLNRIDSYVNMLDGKTINIMADIELPGDFEGINLQSTCSVTINGNHHTISNLKKPLFTGESFVRPCLSGSVKDLNLKGNINDNRAASIAAFATNISLENCTFEGELQGYNVGGFIGYALGDGGAPVCPNVSIKNCLVDAKLSGNGAVGGVIGAEDKLANATFENCGVYLRAVEYFNYGGIDYPNAYGGFIGSWNSSSSVTLKNSYLYVDSSNCNLTPICGNRGDGLPKSGTVNAYYNDSAIYQDDGVTNSINDKATPMEVDLMKASSEETGALVDILNANVTDANEYRRWSIEAGSLPTFEPVEEPAYTIETNMDSLSFDTVNQGYAQPQGKEITITNTGNQNVTLTQPMASYYDVQNLGKTELAPGESVTFTVTPKAGLADGIYEETLTVSTSERTTVDIRLHFNVNPAFSVSIDPTVVTITDGKSQVLSAIPAGGSGAYTYAWRINGSQTQIGNTQAITVSPTTTTTYEVMVRDTIEEKFATATITVAKKEETVAPEYVILNGAGSVFIIGKDTSLSIRGSGAYSKFKEVMVDGVVVDLANYKVSEGSTIITLQGDYLKSLKLGKHRFSLVWTDGFVDTTFAVQMAETGGDTSENKNNTGNETVTTTGNGATAATGNNGAGINQKTFRHGLLDTADHSHAGRLWILMIASGSFVVFLDKKRRTSK